MINLKQFFLFPETGQYISFDLTGDTSLTGKPGLTFGTGSGSFRLIHIKLVLPLEMRDTTKVTFQPFPRFLLVLSKGKRKYPRVQILVLTLVSPPPHATKGFAFSQVG